MFYSHQLLARKAPLGQIWMAATMHAKINRRKLDKLNIIKICEEILNPSIPMALRLSGILMEGVVIVYERKVKLLYDDVTRLMVEINEVWKVKDAPDQKVLPKRKHQAKKEAITMFENEEMTLGDIEQSHQFSDATAITGFQQGSYFNMRLDNLDEAYVTNGERQEKDPTEQLHQADPENITLIDSYQATAYPHNRFERFDIEGDDETQVNVPSADDTQIPITLIPSPPHRDGPKEGILSPRKKERMETADYNYSADDIIEDRHPGDPIIQQSNEAMAARQECRRRGPTKRKRGQPKETTMDYEHTMIPAPLYQDWLQNTYDIVSRRGRKKKGTDILSSKKIANLMKMPPVVLICDLFTSENKDIYYPAPLLDLWIKSNQPPHDSPSAGVSAHHPPEPSFSSPRGGHDGDFTHFGDFEPPEKLRNNNQNTEVFMAKLRANLDHSLLVPEAAPHVSSQKSGGDDVHSIPSSVSERGLSSHSDLGKGRISNRLTKRRLSSSGNSSGGLEPVDEDETFKLTRLSDIGPTPDQELLMETGPTQTQANINHPRDKIADSIQAQMKAHFETHGNPQVESLDLLAAGMTRKSAAQLFYQTCVLASRDALRVEQKVPYGEILISRGSKM